MYSSFASDKIHTSLTGDWFETARQDMMDAVKLKIQYMQVKEAT